ALPIWDWIIGIVVTAIIIGALYWIRSQPIEEEAAGPMLVESVSFQYQSDPHREQGALAHEERVITTRRSSPSTIGRVFECEQDGQLVLSDQPCGADANVREIAAQIGCRRRIRVCCMSLFPGRFRCRRGGRRGRGPEAMRQLAHGSMRRRTGSMRECGS